MEVYVYMDEFGELHLRDVRDGPLDGMPHGWVYVGLAHLGIQSGP